MMPRLTFLLISLCLTSAAAQNAPATKADDKPKDKPVESQTAIPAARPSPNAAPTAMGKAAPAAAAPSTPTPTVAPAQQPSQPTAAPPASPPRAEPAPSAPPKKPGGKGKEEPPPPPPKREGPIKPPACAVAEFRAIGMDNTDEQTRRTKATAWLKKKAPICSAEQLIVIRNNRSQWLGAADSAALAAMVDGLLESFAETNPEVAILLYGTPPPPPKPPEDKKKAAGGAKK
jgi:hypothetical protein